MLKQYTITLTYKDTTSVDASNEAEAKQIALEVFNENKPEFRVDELEVYTSEPLYVVVAPDALSSWEEPQTKEEILFNFWGKAKDEGLYNDEVMKLLPEDSAPEWFTFEEIEDTWQVEIKEAEGE